MNSTKKELYSCFDSAYKNFRIDKVHYAMDALNIRWIGIGRVPTIKELEHHIMGLFRDAIFDMEDLPDGVIMNASSGGFEVVVTDSFGTQEPSVKIRFVLAEGQS